MQTLLENIPQLLGYLFGAGGIMAYIFERRRKQAEAQGVEADSRGKEIENKSNLVNVYREALDDFNVRCEKKVLDITELCDRKVQVLNEEIAAHKRINANLRKENSELTKQNTELRRQNAELRRQNEQLKRKNEELTIIIQKLEKRIAELESNSTK